MGLRGICLDLAAFAGTIVASVHVHEDNAKETSSDRLRCQG
jgi:hypothetical protein